MEQKEIISFMSDYIPRYQNYPVRWYNDIIGGNLETYQTLCLEKLAATRFVSMSCATGVGKTYISSIVFHWFLSTHFQSNVILTAPTERQLNGALWKEVLLRKEGSRGNVLNLIEENNQERLWMRNFKDSWFGEKRLGRADNASEASEAMSGMHSEGGILFIVDEASGVAESIFAAMEGSFTDANSYCLMLSNPMRSSGSFHRSFHEESSLWSGIKVTSFDSSRVDPSYPVRMEARFGKHHPVYRSKVLAEFPRNAGEEMSIFETELDQMRQNSETDVDPYVIVVGLDIARYGGDLTVMVCRKGFEIFDIVTAPKMDTYETTQWVWGRLRMINRTFPDHPIEINVDAIGLGAGVADGLKHKVQDYNRDSKTVILMRLFPIESSRKSEDSMFANVRTESFFNAKEAIKKMRFKEGLDPTPILNDLTDIRYDYDRFGRIQAEAKEEIKKRRHGISPDFGDAFILAVNNYSGTSYESTRKLLMDEARVSAGKLLTKQSVFGEAAKLSGMNWSN